MIRNEDEVKKYFLNVLKCNYVPKEIITYYSKNDGFREYVTEVFPLERIRDELDFFMRFLDAMEIDYNIYKYVPVANDGMGGYYAFLSNKNDKKIYYLDHEFPDDIYEYDNFNEFIEEAKNNPTEIDDI